MRFNEKLLLAQVAGYLNGGPYLGLDKYTPAPLGFFDNTAFTGSLLQGLVAAQTHNNIILNNAQAQALAAQLDGGHVENFYNTSETNSYDLFGDITYKANDKWEFSAGLRYTKDEKTTHFASSVDGRSILGGVIGASGLAASGSASGIATAQALLNGLAYYGSKLNGPLPLFAITSQPTTNNGDWYSQEFNDDGLTWRLTGRYSINETSNLYATYARGRRPGVLTANPPTSPYGAVRFTEVPAETADSIEFGYKALWRSINLSFDSSVYYYDYENLQTAILVGSVQSVTNAGKASAYGLELQANWHTSGWLDLFGSYAYNHARLDNGAYKGNSFARSPDHMASIGASFNYKNDAGTFYLRPTYTYRSKIFFDDDNDISSLQTGRIVADLIQDEYQDGFGLLNVRAGYIPKNGRWEAEAFVTNATDEVYRKGAGSAGESIGMPTNVLGEPRVYGLRLIIRK